MTKPVILKNWGCAESGDGYTPPEWRSLVLRGEVYGHPNFEDGHRVMTSAIVSARGRLVTTKSREYLLDGPPDPAYVEYLNEIGYVFDPENPIKVRNG